MTGIQYHPWKENVVVAQVDWEADHNPKSYRRHPITKYLGLKFAQLVLYCKAAH
jgi:hypothetical protein